MSTFAKRLPVYALVGLMLIMIGSSFGRRSFAQEPTPDAAATEVPTEAAAPAASGLPDQKPTIIGNLNSTTVEGVPGSFCWPQGEGTPQCSFVDDPQPTVAINVVNGDAIVFSTEPASPAPQTFIATLLDDKNADGEPLEINLSNLGGIFTVNELSNGSHRLQVDALYTSDAANQPFVSTVYLLSVGGSAPAPTDVAPTEAGTPAETAVATETGNATDTGAPTEVTAGGATATPTFDLFGNGSQNTSSETATATTEGAATEVATEVPTEATTPAEVTPSDLTATPTETPVTEVAVTQTSTETPTEAATTEGATATTVVETVAPTLTPTFPPLPTFTAAAPDNTATPIVVEPTTVPPTLLPPTEQPVSGNNGSNGNTINVTIPVPQAKIIVGGRSYDPVAINACTGTPTTQYVCVTQPLNVAVPRVVAGPGDAAQVAFSGPRPTGITLSVLSSDGSKVIGTAQIRPDNLILYNLPPVPGNYVITVEFVYPDGKATFFYRLGLGA